jgi:hypothetical protein
VLDLVQTLIDGEYATDEEQDDGDDESIDVPGTPVTELVLRRRFSFGAVPTNQEQNLVERIRH